MQKYAYSEPPTSDMLAKPDPWGSAIRLAIMGKRMGDWGDREVGR